MKYIEIITLRSLVKDKRQLVDELLTQVFKHGTHRHHQGISAP